MKGFFKVLLLCGVGFVAQAQDYTYTVPAFTDSGIKVNYVDVKYGADKTLSVVVESDDSAGKLATGFNFVISDGPAASSSGELVKVYFDASNPNNVVLSSYAYNAYCSTCGGDKCDIIYGSHKYGSTPGKYSFPDRISSSASSTSNQLQFIQKTAVYKKVGSVTTATFYLKLDTTYINMHSPHYIFGSTYKGIKFGPKIGLWGWLVSGSSSAYFAPGDTRPNTSTYSEVYNPYWTNKNSGYLKTINVLNCTTVNKSSAGEICNATTNVLPMCEAVTSDKLEVGKTGKVSIRIRDNESDSLKIEYDSLPTGFVPAIPNGSSVKPVSQLADVEFTATPVSSQLGTLIFNIKVTQSYGGRFDIVCPVRVSIDGVGVKCDETDITAKLVKLDGASSNVAFFNRVIADSARALIAYKPTKTEKVTLNSLTSLIANNNKAKDNAWHNIWTISRVQTVCNGTKDGCTLRSQDAPITAYKASVAELNDLAAKIVSSARAVDTRVCSISGKKAYINKYPAKERGKAKIAVTKLCNASKSILGKGKNPAVAPVNQIATKVKEAGDEIQTIPGSTLCCGKC